MCIPRTRAATQALRLSSSDCSLRQGTMILCAPNGNAIEGLGRPILSKLPPISPAGLQAAPYREHSGEQPRMIRRVKYYGRLAARGIVNRSRKDITECLTMHPLVGSYSLANKLTDGYIKAQRAVYRGLEGLTHVVSRFGRCDQWI